MMKKKITEESKHESLYVSALLPTIIVQKPKELHYLIHFFLDNTLHLLECSHMNGMIN